MSAFGRKHHRKSTSKFRISALFRVDDPLQLYSFRESGCLMFKLVVPAVPGPMEQDFRPHCLPEGRARLLPRAHSGPSTVEIRLPGPKVMILTSHPQPKRTIGKYGTPLTCSTYGLQPHHARRYVIRRWRTRHKGETRLIVFQNGVEELLYVLRHCAIACRYFFWRCGRIKFSPEFANE